MAGYLFPVEGGRITSYFGNRSAPAKGATSNHQGIDISVPSGTSVMAALSGVINQAGYNSTAGNYVTVNHGNGLETTYKHLSRVLVPTRGEKVSQGQIIGMSGNSGVSTGPHLHFEIKKDGKAVDPMSFNNAGASGIMPDLLGGVNMNTDKMLDAIKNNWLVIAVGLLIFAIIK